MIGGDGQSGSTAATFELERFAWGAPDRLIVAGRFMGLANAPRAAPVLVLRGPDQMHRLEALPDSLAAPPEEGSLWSAEFAWQEPPVAFDAAALELGPDLIVELPEPGAKRRRLRGQTLEVRGAATDAADPEPVNGAGQEAEPEAAPAGRGAQRVRLEADLLAAQLEIRELRDTAERAQEELARAREDLKAERERHAGDADRFREGLAAVRASAAEALAAEQHAAQQAASDLGDARLALEAQEAALQDLRGQLDEAAAARTQAESEAAAAAALRQQLAGIDDARSAAEEARADGERMLSRLETIRDALANGK